MNREDIIRMAREAGLMSRYDETSSWIEDHPITEYVESFAALVAAAEREACAKVAENQTEEWEDTRPKLALTECATAIRARGAK